MAVTRVDFDEETYRTLEQAARRRGITVAELLRELAGDLVRGPDDPADSREAMLAFVGQGRSGLGDLAERHDHYLAGGDR